MAGKRSAAKNKNPLTAKKGPSQATVLGIIVVVAFAALVGFGVYWNSSSSSTLVPANATASGVPVGNADAPTTIDVYVDFQCPHCATFEEQAGPTLEELRNSGQAQVVYHPVAFLDRASTTQFSTRAGAASGCAAEAGVYPEFEKLLFANQPAQGGEGLSNDQLAQLGQQAGAGPEFAECVEDQRFAPWTQEITQQALRDNISGTPSVRVNGQDVEASPQAIQQAVAAG
ncbi:thioredoxin domain-containing protein [Pseudonocardia sp. NPDC049635]|uniref:DsbA family protein n=1 Tax=Pseudonocardia sp. NPDC049635 TaxID=3155506 RepID=UPI00340B6FE2